MHANSKFRKLAIVFVPIVLKTNKHVKPYLTAGHIDALVHRH